MLPFFSIFQNATGKMGAFLQSHLSLISATLVTLGLLALAGVFIYFSLGVWLSFQRNLKKSWMNLPKYELCSTNDCTFLWSSYREAFVAKKSQSYGQLDMSCCSFCLPPPPNLKSKESKISAILLDRGFPTKDLMFSFFSGIERLSCTFWLLFLLSLTSPTW